MPSGAGNFKLGGAYVELSVNNRKFVSGLADVHKKMLQAQAKWASMFSSRSLAGPTTQIGNLTRQVQQLRTALGQAATNAKRLNAAMSGGRGKGIAAALKAQAQANATMIRAQGRARQLAIRGVGQGLGDAARGFGSALAQNIRATASPIRAMSGLLSGVARGFSALFLAPFRALRGMFGAGGLIGGIGAGFGTVKVAQAAMRREDRRAEIGRLSGLRGPALDRLVKQLEDVATRRPGTSLATSFEAAQVGLRAGVPVAGITKYTRTLTDISKALTDLPINEAAERLARLRGIFGLTTEATRGLASAIVGLDNASTASGREILDIAQRASSAGKLLGLSAQQVLALSAAARETGAMPHTAGTALSQILGRMAESGKASAFGRIAGMSAERFTALRRQNALGALQAVGRGLGGMNAEQGVSALGSVGVDGQRARMVLLGLSNVQDRLARFTATANAEFRSQAAIDDAVALKSSTLSARWTQLKAQTEAMAASIGRALTPALRGVSDGFGALSVDIQKWADSSKAWLEGVGKGIGGAIRNVSLLLREFATLKGLSISYIKEGFSRLGDGLYQNLKFAFVDALPKLVANTFNGLGRMVLDFFKRLATRIGNEIHNVIAADVNDWIDTLPAWLTGGQKNKMQFRPLPPVGFDASKFGNPLEGIGRAPGLKPFLDQRHSRAAERAPLHRRIAEARAAQDMGNRDITPGNAASLLGGAVLGPLGRLAPMAAGFAARNAESMRKMLTPRVPRAGHLSPVQRAARAQVMSMKAVVRRQAEFAHYGFSPTAAMEARMRRLHGEQEAKPKPTPGEEGIMSRLDKIIGFVEGVMKAGEKVAHADTGRRPGLYDGAVSGVV